MELNADFSRRVAVHAARLPWVASPMAGVERRMLDRIGDEVLAPHLSSATRRGAISPPHTHDGGEEFFVLEGIFQDEHGEFPCRLVRPQSADLAAHARLGAGMRPLC